MRTCGGWLILGTALMCAAIVTGCGKDGEHKKRPAFTIVIHGGAGTILKEDMTPEKEELYRNGLIVALQAGYAVLRNGGSSLDAVEVAVRSMEDSPLFNAGRGAVFTSEGKNEMDASIMDGKTLNAGAVASVTTIKHPVSAARAVMTESKHVLLAGRGAEIFAAQQGLEIVDSDFFFEQRRWNQLLKAKESEQSTHEDKKAAAGGFGTVGAVALDREGNLAACTSTGGLTNKLPGRIGDSPIIGAGTYANNATCAVSATGQGEFFMRNVVAYDISAMMEYAGLGLQDAANRVIHEKLTSLGGTGGVIALDGRGNITMTFNTEGMYRGYMIADGEPHVYFYREGSEER
jgi:beta-aspartyl-peptidase (threonine type)